MTHKMLTSKYREQFGLDNNAKLMSEASIELARKRNKENYDTVVTENLITLGYNTRYKKGSPGRLKNMMREQTRLRLKLKGN